MEVKIDRKAYLKLKHVKLLVEKNIRNLEDAFDAAMIEDPETYQFGLHEDLKRMLVETSAILDVAR